MGHRRTEQFKATDMPLMSQHFEETSFSLSVDAALKAAFTAAAEAEDRSAADLVRDFMRRYVNERERRAFEAEARRQSMEAAERARDPNSDEAEILRWIEAVADTDGWTA